MWWQGLQSAVARPVDVGVVGSGDSDSNRLLWRWFTFLDSLRGSSANKLWKWSLHVASVSCTGSRQPLLTGGSGGKDWEIACDTPRHCACSAFKHHEDSVTVTHPCISVNLLSVWIIKTVYELEQGWNYDLCVWTSEETVIVICWVYRCGMDVCSDCGYLCLLRCAKRSGFVKQTGESKC